VRNPDFDNIQLENLVYSHKRVIMKKLDLYLLILALGVLLLIWRYETGEVVKIVAYLAAILGLYFSIALARIKRKKKRRDVSWKGLAVLATGHILMTILFFWNNNSDEKDWIVSAGEFLIYLALIVFFTIVVVANCSSVMRGTPVEEEKANQG